MNIRRAVIQMMNDTVPKQIKCSTNRYRIVSDSYQAINCPCTIIENLLNRYVRPTPSKKMANKTIWSQRRNLQDPVEELFN